MICLIYIVLMFSLVIVMLRVGHQNVYHSSLQAIFKTIIFIIFNYEINLVCLSVNHFLSLVS